MTTPLLQTKLYVPVPRPELVPRPRLIERLNLGLHRKLALISAPAGFGKTTLVSAWVQALADDSSPIAVGWLSLDEGDDDLARFLRYLIAALQTTQPHIGKGALSALESPQPPPAEGVLTATINEIAAIPDRIVLVLDDYHVIETQSVHDALSFLLRHLPPNLHLAIATRVDPPLPLARMRARGQLTELRAADLRFSAPEAGEFLNQAMGLDLTAADVTALERRTEGWIAGLQLAAVSLQGRRGPGTPNAADFIQAFAGSHRYILDYLMEEVLEQQPPGVQTFLLQTSVLDRLTGSLCDAVRFGATETPGSSEGPARPDQEASQALLAKLERANLFVVPLDEERHWYRYHHLFSDLLRRRLRSTRPDLMPSLHHRAGEWYTRNGFPSEAVHHALAGGDTARAADLIESIGLGLIGQGAFTTVRTWIDTLPESLVRSRPYLCLHHAWASNFAHQLDAVEPFLQYAQRAVPAQGQSKHDAVAGDVHGQIATLRAWNARRQRNNSLAIELLEKAADNLGDGNPWVSTYTELNLGLAYLDGGELVQAACSFRSAVSLGRASENELASLTATSHLATVLVLQGRLHQAAELCRQTIGDQLARYEQPPPTLCMVYLRLGWVLAEWNDVDGFLAHLSQGVLLADQMGYDSVVEVGARTMAWEKQLLAQQGTAIEFSEDVASVIDRVLTPETGAGVTLPPLVDDAPLAPEVQMQLTETYLADEAYFEVWPGYSDHFQASRLAREGRIAEALDLLARIRESAQEVRGHGLMIEARVIEALIHQAQGDLDHALRSLECALSMGEAEGYIRTFADRGRPMARLLYQALDRGIASDYARRLLASFAVGEPEETMPASAQVASSGLIEPLSDREIEVLQLIAEGMTNREIGSRLYLSPHTIKVHTRNLYGKLGVHNRVSAVARGRALGILPST